MGAKVRGNAKHHSTHFVRHQDICYYLKAGKKAAGELMLGFCCCLFSIIEGFVGHIMVDPFYCIYFDAHYPN